MDEPWDGSGWMSHPKDEPWDGSSHGILWMSRGMAQDGSSIGWAGFLVAGGMAPRPSCGG